MVKMENLKQYPDLEMKISNKYKNFVLFLECFIYDTLRVEITALEHLHLIFQ